MFNARCSASRCLGQHCGLWISRSTSSSVGAGFRFAAKPSVWEGPGISTEHQIVVILQLRQHRLERAQVAPSTHHSLPMNRLANFWRQVNGHSTMRTFLPLNSLSVHVYSLQIQGIQLTWPAADDNAERSASTGISGSASMRLGQAHSVLKRWRGQGTALLGVSLAGGFLGAPQAQNLTGVDVL